MDWKVIVASVCCGGPLFLIGLVVLVWVILPLLAWRLLPSLRWLAEIALMPIFMKMKKWAEAGKFSWGQFVAVQEGTAVVGQRGKEAVDAFLRWGGHKIDSSTGEIVRADDSWHPFGGLVFMGFGVAPMTISARWVSRENDRIVPREEQLEALVVTPLVNVIQVTAAEATGGLVGDFEVDVHFRIVNPLQYARVAFNAMKTITSLVTTAFVTQVGRQDLRDIFGHQDEVSRALMVMMESSGTFKSIRQEFGLCIERLVIPEIAPADQNLIAAQARAKIEAEARVTTEKGKGDAWAAKARGVAGGIRGFLRALFRG